MASVLSAILSSSDDKLINYMAPMIKKPMPNIFIRSQLEGFYDFCRFHEISRGDVLSSRNEYVFWAYVHGYVVGDWNRMVLDISIKDLEDLLSMENL